MVAITVTADNKANSRLQNIPIGYVFKFTKVPKKWIYNNQIYFDFDERKDENGVLLSYLAGFRDVVIDEPTESQKQGQITWEESADHFLISAIDLTPEDLENIEAERIANLRPLVAVFAEEIGYMPHRDTDVPIDQLEIFKPTEKVYNLKGEAIRKDYYKGDVLVCSIIYSKEYDDLEFEGIIKNELVAISTTFRFYKTEDSLLYDDKVMQKLNFQLVPTTIPTPEDPEVVLDVMWSSAKREELLRSERYKADEVMKTFNPSLYYLFTNLFAANYQRYKETGYSEDLKSEVLAAALPKLDEQVLDEDKAVIFGPMETYPSLTIREMIIGALQ